MSTSGAPTYNNATYGQNGVQTGGQLSIGGDMPVNMNVHNPYQMDPSQLNPAAAPYLKNVSDAANHSMPGSDWYNQMQHTEQSGLTSSMDNQYAAMGLSGSSAEMGGVSHALQQNQMAWVNRQQGDAAKSAQMNQQAYGMATGIQNQYGDYEQTYNQDLLGLLGLQQQEKQSNQQMWGGIISGVAGGAAKGAAMAAG